MFTSRVERTISAAHHNGPPGSRCANNHGHDWGIIVEISYDEEQLDQYGWGPDFGTIKQILDRYDHKDLNVIGPIPPSAEMFAKHLAEEIEKAIGWSPNSVEVSEGNGNFVTWVNQ